MTSTRDDVITEEIERMWQSYQRLCPIWHTLDNPESYINDSLIDILSRDANASNTSAHAIAMFGNYLKFMFSSQKDGIVLPPTEETFRNWYRMIPLAFSDVVDSTSETHED